MATSPHTFSSTPFTNGIQKGSQRAVWSPSLARFGAVAAASSPPSPGCAASLCPAFPRLRPEEGRATGPVPRPTASRSRRLPAPASSDRPRWDGFQHRLAKPPAPPKEGSLRGHPLLKPFRFLWAAGQKQVLRNRSSPVSYDLPYCCLPG